MIKHKNKQVPDIEFLLTIIADSFGQYAEDLISVDYEDLRRKVALDQGSDLDFSQHSEVESIVANLIINHDLDIANDFTQISFSGSIVDGDNGYLNINEDNAFWNENENYHPIRAIEMFHHRLMKSLDAMSPDYSVKLEKQSRRSFHDFIEDEKASFDPSCILMQHLGLIEVTHLPSHETFGIIVDFDRMPATQSRVEDQPGFPLLHSSVFFSGPIDEKMKSDIKIAFDAIERKSLTQHSDSDEIIRTGIKGREPAKTTALDAGYEGLSATCISPDAILSYFIALSEGNTMAFPKSVQAVNWSLSNGEISLYFEMDDGKQIYAKMELKDPYEQDKIFFPGTVSFFDTDLNKIENLLSHLGKKLIHKIVSDNQLAGMTAGRILNDKHQSTPKSDIQLKL